MKEETCLPKAEEYKQQLEGLAEPLLKWYDREARVLPWRSRPEPYRVWVSEIMLQQTRVEAALPYFERFMAALPDVAALAAAPEAMLMKLWEGLGYYSRVRNLQRSAAIVMERFGGELPSSPEGLRELPGIGEYTAGAIASIAFGRSVEAVDGNVLRVLARVLACDADVARPDVKQAFRLLARGMLPPARPGDFNQALMDLGATVCLPNGEPLCKNCPWAERCAGRRLGLAAGLPAKAPKKPREIRRRTVFVLRSRGRALLVRRPPAGLLAGLWELPGVEEWLDERQAAAWLSKWGANAAALRPVGEAKHVFTHVEWHMRCFVAEVGEFAPAGREFVWADAAALRETYAVPSAFKAFAWLLPGGDDENLRRFTNL